MGPRLVVHTVVLAEAMLVLHTVVLAKRVLVQSSNSFRTGLAHEVIHELTQYNKNGGDNEVLKIQSGHF